MPNKIQNTIIRVVTEKQADKIAKYRKSLTYINIIENIAPEESQFLVVSFYVQKNLKHINYLPMHNCNIFLKHDKRLNTIYCTKIAFEYPYFNYKLRINK